MSREDYEMLKQIREWQESRKKDDSELNEENDELIIEQNTIYEIDYDCYECLMKDKKNYYKHGED